ncbi:MAG: hypothetical protein Q7S58_03315 [Candidatus Binatus sp.]|uniref:hypothetical protein n=1 Tax=Candidatus Binatus sp. TaxID=2811406 RepID=UPI00271D7E19|nr:hypothetical protein [Candidatus Binatus sp.]MDO8431419.1 hypothetical protein [Candidatus Binatus sp.]
MEKKPEKSLRAGIRQAIEKAIYLSKEHGTWRDLRNTDDDAGRLKRWKQSVPAQEKVG